jgi:hypothetical protein
MEKQESIVGKKTIININSNITLIKQALKSYLNADVTEAQSGIREIIHKYIRNSLLVSDINENYAFRGFDKNDDPLCFFRGRIKKGSDKFKRNELFHVPFNERYKISTERYSISGVPCLYVATTSYCVWIELQKPKLENFYCSAFKLPNNFKVLNLCIVPLLLQGQASKIENELLSDPNSSAKSDFLGLLELFPLVIACSYKFEQRNINSDDNRKFKSEYIIPQLLMQVIRSMNIDGVAYYSMNANHNLSFLKGVSLAIIANCDEICEQDKIRYNTKMSSEIQLTEPKLFTHDLLNKVNFEESEYKSYVNKNCREPHKQIDLLVEDMSLVRKNYQDTVFSKFDEYLLRQSFDYI